MNLRTKILQRLIDEGGYSRMKHPPSPKQQLSKAISQLDNMSHTEFLILLSEALERTNLQEDYR